MWTSSVVTDRRCRFRPCIDLHQGRVKQIVGGSLDDDGADENFVSDLAAGDYAARYRTDRLTGGHIIKLGPGNDEAAREALAAWPGGMQLGGGITAGNAADWIEAGAGAVIVTSWLFDETRALSEDRLKAVRDAVGAERLVVDLSCRAEADGGWVVAMDRWRARTQLRVDHRALDRLAGFCTEFLIHAADVEGLCRGIDEALVRHLGAWDGDRPIVYAGGARSFDDLARVEELGRGRIDLTIGSALDLFGGTVPYADCVAWNRRAS